MLEISIAFDIIFLLKIVHVNFLENEYPTKHFSASNFMAPLHCCFSGQIYITDGASLASKLRKYSDAIWDEFSSNISTKA